ncbi:KilA-N domain-containing protein [Phaeobacter gallaeciensis]|uniref:KilA-N domain protein n=1 Tax=Phaeobacter gallaeciensis TaxID=60890 RepID=A0AAD0EDC3_9RHOB|nr:KilA-N domain-containing protein [Phaeobacter gallaeciensis]AHD09997.1 KilA-N domain protein [Phaeobacter gallaeciensis DSM 26640]ATE93261.1 KilA-N domain protein [Phaeobacter gallaeciensis]ATE96918.1 KilA-N domain protein [Phaeobacter gallaeciensis]ATF01925.1 KilA-N domain protein [Phaeobacter gallaeciensis]ATF06305.1 KilA-N domain protein [Phaeobacter gallaeciensis]
MTKHEIITGSELVYGGVAIREKGEMLSLTDMWKAAGSTENKEPYNWARFEGRAFIDAVAVSQNLSEAQVLTSKRGKNGGTFAHWQIGIAYAKYLSHDFHMWGNQAIREKMEGVVQHLPADVLEQIVRTNGIARMLSGKVTAIEGQIATMATAVTAIATVVQPSSPGVYVEGKTSGQIWSSHNLPPLKNAPRWLGNRLAEMGCQIEHCRTAQLGMRGARMFDPDKASACMKNGLLHKAKVYASERMGQSKLKLIGGAK